MVSVDRVLLARERSLTLDVFVSVDVPSGSNAMRLKVRQQQNCLTG
jgi:hypothetical protein